MENLTKDRDLSRKENEIKNLIASGDPTFAKAFDLLYSYFYLDYLFGKSNYFLVMRAVYVDDCPLRKWDVANKCHLGKTSFFAYRNKIIDLYYICLNNVSSIPEVAVTKG